MPSDLYAERLRIVSGSSNWTLSTMTGSNPNGIASEPTGSLLRTPDGGIWINSNGGTEWQRLGAGVLTGTYVATGGEGSQASITLPTAFQSNQYRVFITNVSGTTVSAYQVPEALRTTTGFRVNSTSPFSSGDKLDWLAMSGTIYAGGVTVSGGGGGSAGTGSITITSASMPASVNMTTEGPLDWYAMPSYTSLPRALTQGQPYSKAAGGWILNTFNWNSAGTSWSTSQTGFGATKTATTSDSTNASALNTTQAGYIFTVSGATTGWGFTFRVPASTKTRVLRIYTGHWSSVFKWTAQLTDGSAVSTNITSSGASVQLSLIITVTFAASTNCELILRAEAMGNYTADPNLVFAGATLSGSF